MGGLNTEVLAFHFFIEPEIAGRRGVYEGPFAQNMQKVSDTCGKGKVLFNKKNGKTAFFQLQDRFTYSLDQKWGQALTRFVHEEQVRVCHQGPGDSQHLLLSSAQLVSPVMAPLPQYRKEGEDFLFIPGTRLLTSDSHAQVLQNGKGREDAPPLGNQPHLHPHNLVGRHVGDVRSLVHYLPPPRMNETDDGSDKGCFAHPVPADDAYDLSVLDFKGDSLKDVTLGIIGMDILDFQYIHDLSVPR